MNKMLKKVRTREINEDLQMMIIPARVIISGDLVKRSLGLSAAVVTKEQAVDLIKTIRAGRNFKDEPDKQKDFR